MHTGNFQIWGSLSRQEKDAYLNAFEQIAAASIDLHVDQIRQHISRMEDDYGTPGYNLHGIQDERLTFGLLIYLQVMGIRT